MSGKLLVLSLVLVLIVLSSISHASADSSNKTISTAMNGTNMTKGTGMMGGTGAMLNGTRMVTDSKTCLASVDRCVMVKMMHLAPKIQMEAGLGALDVACNTGFELVLKATDATPACVSPPTATELVARGWALSQDDVMKIRAMYEPGRQ